MKKNKRNEERDTDKEAKIEQTKERTKKEK
jgi:hypothetical protein